MNENTLFDPNGTPVAYISWDHDSTVYLFSGDPVAYLYDDHVYGFNGRHLGWFEQGIVWDSEGKRVGFTRRALTAYAGYEPYKSYKKYRPYKAYRQYAPYKPYKQNSASNVPLEHFLRKGR